MHVLIMSLPDRPTMTLEQRLRAALERFGRHEPLCPAATAIFGGRCKCGLHKALADHDGFDEEDKG